MLSYSTIEPHTLELLKYLMAEPYLKDCRLVGGTSLAFISQKVREIDWKKY